MGGASPHTWRLVGVQDLVVCTCGSLDILDLWARGQGWVLDPGSGVLTWGPSLLMTLSSAGSPTWVSENFPCLCRPLGAFIMDSDLKRPALSL